MPSLDLRAPLRLLARTPDLRLLLGAGLVSLSGDWLLGVGLAYSVYALTGSTVASAATLLSSFIPQALLGSFAGVFVDRWDRKRTMVVADLLLALGLVPLLFVDGADRIWLVYVVLAAEACVEVFFTPAERALLPRVVPDEDLLAANGLNGQVQNLARLFGSALGGLAAGLGGIGAVAFADGATFLVGALLVSRIRVSGRAERPAEGDAGVVVRGRVATLLEEWRVGFRTVATTPVVRALVIALLITGTGEGIMGTLFAPYVRHVLHGSAQVYGLITGVQAIGGVIGGFLVAVVAERWSAVTMVWLGAIVFGLIDLAIFLYPLLWVTPWPAAVGMVVVGLPGAVVTAGVMTLFQRYTTDDRRGRVFSLVTLAEAISLVIGSTVAGALGGSVGIIPVLAFQGVGYVVAGLFLGVLLTRSSAQGPVAATVDHQAGTSGSAVNVGGET
jgi:Na+/melibiose symporter-like transporter